MVVSKCISKCSQVTDCEKHQPMCKMFVSQRAKPYCALNRKKYFLDKNQKCKLTRKKSVVKSISRSLRKTSISKKYKPVNKYTFPIQITSASTIISIPNRKNHYMISYPGSKFALFKIGTGNLLYEYFAGLFINDYVNRFPCFIYTCGLLYYHKSGIEWSKFISNQELTKENIMESFYTVDDLLNETIISRACAFDTKAALIQEYIPHTLALDDVPDYHHRLHNLFQVYAPLENMRRNNQFYMFDILNMDTIQIYQLPQPVYFVYQLSKGGFVSFECAYMSKIVNYKNTIFPQTDIIQSMLCSESACAPSCGSTSGFKQFSKTDTISVRERRLLSKYIGHDYDISNIHDILELLAKLIGITYSMDEKTIAKYKPEHVCLITL
jgi:hypothetical protein